jgi:hypothetical protein
VLARLNIRRVALSVAVASAILTPIATGSLKKADRDGWSIDFEDDQERYMAAHGVNRFTCLASRAVALHFGGTEWYANETDRKLCDESKNLIGENVIQKTVFNPTAFTPLLRDVLFGFLVPLVLMSVVPPMARSYFRWITKPTK